MDEDWIEDARKFGAAIAAVSVVAMLYGTTFGLRHFSFAAALAEFGALFIGCGLICINPQPEPPLGDLGNAVLADEAEPEPRHALN